VTIDVLQNDTAGAGAVVTLLPAAEGRGPAAGATAVVNPDGSVTYTPAAGFAGLDNFAYQFTDAARNVSNAASVTVHVVPVEVITVTQARLGLRNLRLDIRGTSTFDGSTLEVRGDGGAVLGTVVVNGGRFRYRGTATSSLTSVEVVNPATGKSTSIALQVR
jgi:hypothetical protein